MEITVQLNQDINVATLVGDIDSSTAATVTEQVLPLIQPQGKIILEMDKVLYMSSAGLRMLLSLYRQASAQDSQLVLVGLAEDIQDTMSVTGFLKFFRVFQTLNDGLDSFKEEF
jgi:anti-sigma B factor antagonist